MASPTFSSDVVTSSTGSGSGSGTSSGASSDVECDGLTPLRCVLCQKVYTNPRVLSCFHTFCYDCLARVQEAHERITCPTCQTETYLSSAGLGSLMPDYAIINLVQEQTFDAATQPCGGCRGRSSTEGVEKSEESAPRSPVIAHCFDCGYYLCPSCHQAHRFMHCFDDHQLVPLGDNFSSRLFKQYKTVRCPRHRAENLNLYCRTCSIPICKDCTKLDHPGHSIFVVSEVVEIEIEHLLRLGCIADGKIQELRMGTKNVEQSSVFLQQQHNKAKAAIDETYNFFLQALEERRAGLLKELDMAFNDKQVILSSAAQDMTQNITKVNSANQFIAKLVQHASKVETLVCKAMVENKLRSVIDYCSNIIDSPQTFDIEFSSSKQNIQVAVRNTYGVIKQIKNGSTVNRRPSIPNISQNQVLDNLTAVNSILQQASFHHNPMLPNGLGQTTMGNFDASIFNGGLISSNSTLSGVSHWNNGSDNNISNPDTIGDVFSNAGMFMSTEPTKSKSSGGELTPPKSSLPRTKMVYNQKFGEFGSSDGQFTEPSGVAVNVNGEILVADTNNHRIQIFDRNGEFRFQFGQCGKRDGQLLYPNRVAVCRLTGNIIVTERSPTHQVQIFTQDGQFIRKFGSNKLQHPRGVTVDKKGRIIIVECKVMRVIIFDQNGNELYKFGCSKHLEFPNGVVVNDKEEIFISDNRSHCVKVFNYGGVYLRQIGGEGLTNYPIGVGITTNGEVLIADNHNNFNVTVFNQDGVLTHALESRVKHAQCFDVALGEDGTIVLASRDFRVYIYHYAGAGVCSDVGPSGISGVSPPLSASALSAAMPSFSSLFQQPPMSQISHLSQLSQLSQMDLNHWLTMEASRLAIS